MIELKIPEDAEMIRGAIRYLQNLANQLSPDNSVALATSSRSPSDLRTEQPEYDSAGRVWDERIHSSSKAFMTSGPREGQWKYKRGLDDETKNKIESQHEIWEKLEEPDEPWQAPAPAPVPAPPVVEPPSPAPATFADVLGYITENHVDPDKIQKACIALGMPSIAVGGSHPDKMGPLLAWLKN